MLFIGVMIVCFIVGFCFNDTRTVGLVGLMVLAYLAGAANPITTIDYSTYLVHYNALGWETSPFERGYTQLALLFSNHGVSYAQFRVCFAVLAFVALFLGVCMFTKNVALFAGLYGVSVFFNDATQIRNLMMISIVILGAGFLAQDKPSLKILGVGILWLSTQFHDLGFVFFLLLVPLSFVKFKTLLKFYKIIVPLLFGLGFIFSITSNSSIIQIISNFLTRFSSRNNSAQNVIANFGRGNSNSTTILMWVTLLLFSFALLMLVKIAGHSQLETPKIKILFIGSAIAMLVAFLIVLAPDYSRISRNAFLFFLILMCVVVDQNAISFSRNHLSRIFLLVSVLMLTTYVNTTIWGPLYVNSIPYIARIKN